jgi:hypothetical protein
MLIDPEKRLEQAFHSAGHSNLLSADTTVQTPKR